MAFGLGSILGAVAGPVIGGLLGGSSAKKQAKAIEQSGAATAEASKYAADLQMQQFLQQQANQNLQYGQTRADLSSLFGGSANQNLTGANAGIGITSGKTAEQLRAELLPQFTTQGTSVTNPFASFYSDGSPQANSAANFWALTHPQTGGSTVDETGLNAAIQAALSQQASPSAALANQGSLFGPTTGANDPELQSILSQLQASGANFGQQGQNLLSQYQNFSPTATTDSNLQALLSQLRGAGSQFGAAGQEQLDLFRSFNPQTMAQSIYDKLALLGQPQRERDRANLESRLLNQGILTASPGYSQINAFDEAAGQTDLARQIQAMAQAQQQQQQYAINATGFGQAGAVLGGQAQDFASGARAEDAARQQQLLANSLGLSGAQASLATQRSNIKNAAYAPALQAAGIAAGVPINFPQPIPTGELGVAGAHAAGQANVAAANMRNSFWSSLGANEGFQSGINSLFSGLGNLGNTGGIGLSTGYTGPELYGSGGLFSSLNGYGGGV